MSISGYDLQSFGRQIVTAAEKIAGEQKRAARIEAAKVVLEWSGSSHAEKADALAVLKGLTR